MSASPAQLAARELELLLGQLRHQRRELAAA